MNTKYISKFLFAGILTAASVSGVAAENIHGVITNLPVEQVKLSRNGDNMTLDMDLHFDNYEFKGNKAVLFTPYIVNGNDSLELTSIGVYSRSRWYYYNRKDHMLGEPDAVSMRYSKKLDNIDYVKEFPYQDWMDGAQVAIKSETYKCANCLADEEILYLGAQYMEFHPAYIFAPVEEVLATADVVKTRELTGRAYVDFPVNKIVIYPEYRNNTYELGKIIATIDSVKNDPDVTVTSIHIAGTASPEGPYDNNVYLAKNRTIALKDYVTNLYNFPKDFIQTDYDPVDWKGLREWLENNNLNHKEEILAIVDSNIEPYARNSKIKKDFPTEYDWLLRNVYPALRHSDYRIEYTIRQFNEVTDIATIIHTQPAKLTFREMMLLADQYTPGSDEYNDVFEIAVRMFPDEPIANLNVANAALNRGDLVTAARYLPKAGNSPQAMLARANYAFLTGNMEEAGELYRQAAEYLPEAQESYRIFKAAGY